jgi:hypothetical protein
MPGIRYFQTEDNHIFDLDKVSVFIPGRKIAMGPDAGPTKAQVMLGPLAMQLSERDAEEVENILLCRNTKLVTGVEPCQK